MKIINFENSYQKIEILINKYSNTCFNIIRDQLAPNNNSIIYTTENKELDKVLNMLKGKSFQFFSAIIQFSGMTDITNNTLKEISFNLIDLIIKDLDLLVEQRLFDRQNCDENLEILLYHIFLFLSRSLNREPFLTSFSPYIKK